ncbi:MAG: NAD(P)-dependent oxidoreductase [Magnetovibrio sp.]|nr:NAD(P)-dependent oxidoreductase [Magnetovibrio sp.]
MNPERFGFIGLGQMGGPMAGNIAAKGFPLTVYDKAGTQGLAPEGAGLAADAPGVARAADTVFLSVPDGAVSGAVVDELIATADRRAGVVIDLSTIGPAAARENDAKCRAAGLTYVDAPVSGGQAGARAGTITVMLAGPKDVVEAHHDVLMGFAKNPFHVGETPGQGQAVKILNNFLSGTAMAATTEAVLYGLSQGLDMKTMLDVVNVSTGQNTATADKFPNRILTETFDAGFATALLTKDIRLFLDNAQAAGTPTRIGEAVTALWEDTNEALPGSDFTLIYKLLRDGDAAG